MALLLSLADIHPREEMRYHAMQPGTDIHVELQVEPRMAKCFASIEFGDSICSRAVL